MKILGYRKLIVFAATWVGLVVGLLICRGQQDAGEMFIAYATALGGSSSVFHWASQRVSVAQAATATATAEANVGTPKAAL